MEVQADTETSTWQHTTHTWDIHVLEGFETTIPASYGQQKQAVDRADPGIVCFLKYETELWFMKPGGSLNINLMV